ncbi:MAG: hypothetical protein GY788_00725 [bacterium]|nr:hypothetical protein [bacterium]
MRQEPSASFVVEVVDAFLVSRTQATDLSRESCITVARVRSYKSGMASGLDDAAMVGGEAVGLVLAVLSLG